MKVRFLIFRTQLNRITEVTFRTLAVSFAVKSLAGELLSWIPNDRQSPKKLLLPCLFVVNVLSAVCTVPACDLGMPQQ